MLIMYFEIKRANYKPNSRFPDFSSDFRSDAELRSEFFPELN